MYSAKQVKEMLTPEDIVRLFTNEFHAPAPVINGDGQYMFSTQICHGGDSPTKLWYYPDTHTFYCWTHCHSIDLFEIVRRNKGFDTFIQAYYFVVDYFGLSDNTDMGAFEPPEMADQDIFQHFDDMSPTEEAMYQETILPESILDVFSPPCAPSEWQKDNIAPAVMIHYGIRIDSANQRIIIPHRNIDGKLIGVRCRNFDIFELQYAKYAPISVAGNCLRFPTGRYLFGLYQNKETIKKLHKVLICEGEKSVLQTSSYYGIDNCFCVATCGSNISEEQIDILLGLGVNEVILGYDRDYLGHKGDVDVKKYEQKLYRIIQPLLPYFSCYVVMDYDHLTGYKDSPSDRGREILEKLLAKKIYVPSIGREIFRR